jgi:nucleotide-binding universal stress UspA family protein
MPMLFSTMEEEPARMAREARKTLDDAVGRIEAAGGDVAQAHLKVGGASEEIVALAEELGAGLIVMGNRGRGEEGLDGQRLRLRRPPRPLRRLGGARVRTPSSASCIA